MTLSRRGQVTSKFLAFFTHARTQTDIHTYTPGGIKRRKYKSRFVQILFPRYRRLESSMISPGEIRDVDYPCEFHVQKKHREREGGEGRKGEKVCVRDGRVREAEEKRERETKREGGDREKKSERDSNSEDGEEG